MASTNAANSVNNGATVKPGVSVAQNAVLSTSQPLEDEANSEAEVEPGSSSDSMNVTRVSIPGKMATSAFEIIAVELQPDSSSSPGNGNLHHSSLSLGGATNDTDQEQDFNINGGSLTAEEGLATESETEAAPDFHSLQANDHSTQLNDGASSVLIHRNGPEVNDFVGSNDALITTTAISTNVYGGEPTTTMAVTSSNTLPASSGPAIPIPAPSVSTIKTETGREITILKVEAEFRRGRWQCSDYHDHRDTSPPPPNPSPASGVVQTVATMSQSQLQQQQQPQAQTSAMSLIQAQAMNHPGGVVPSNAHLPVILEQNSAQQQQNLLNGATSAGSTMGMSAVSQRYPQQPQLQPQTYSSTQQMVEKTAAALNRVLSTDPSSYSSAAGGGFAFSHGNALGMNNNAPVLMPSANSTAGGATGFLNTGQGGAGSSGCVADLAAIEVKVAQALDLVKKYLMAAVRHELEAMQFEVVDLQNKLEAVQRENALLRSNVPDDVLQNLLLAEHVQATQPLLQAMTTTPAATSIDPTTTMATPPSPSFVVSTSSPNNNNQPKVSSLMPSGGGAVRQAQQYYSSQVSQSSQRDRSPSETAVEAGSERPGDAGFVSDGGDYTSSPDAVAQT